MLQDALSIQYEEKCMKNGFQVNYVFKKRPTDPEADLSVWSPTGSCTQVGDRGFR